MTNTKLFLASLWLASSMAWAAPGAHGPDGEHLAEPGAGNAAATSTPSTETFTENFELVAKLYSTELSVLVDEYNTNAPVLNATLTLEVGDLTSSATFHEDAGDYAFDDPTLLKVLQQAGQHELIFTLTTPSQTDLLLATLNSSGEATEHVGHGHSHSGGDAHEHHGHFDELLHSPYAISAVALIALGVLIAVVLRVRRNASTRTSKKIQS